MAAGRVRAHVEEPAHAALDAGVHEVARTLGVDPVERLDLGRVDGPCQVDHRRHALCRGADRRRVAHVAVDDLKASR